MTSTAAQVALVTGGGSGIGRAISLALASAGFEIAVAGRRPESLDEVVKLIADRGGKAIAISTDIASPESVAQCFDRVRTLHGRLDVLVNNAGVVIPATPTEDLEFSAWQRVVDTNLTGAFLCTQQAIRLMKAQQPSGGRIINNGSLSAHVPRPNSIAYTATKHAITGLTRATALDGRRHRILCGQIDIGNAATGPTERMSKGVLQPDGSLRSEPTIDPENVARAVVTMATMPLDVNILNLTIMANEMPFVGRG